MRVINEVYAVFFDTNAIKGKYWMDHTVRQHAGSIGDGSMIPVGLYLPEVVQKEWSRYYARHVKEQLDKLAEAREKLLDMKLDKPEFQEFDANKVDENSKKLLTDLGFSFIPTPHTSINYVELVELAINHEPPFEPNDGSDKGLKDAIIAQTIKNFSDTHPEQKIIFIGRDGLMTTYLKTIMRQNTSFATYSSIEELIEELKLKNNNLSKDLAQGASEAFFVQELKDSFFYRLNVRDLLIGKYRSKLVDAEAAKNYLKSVKIESGGASQIDVSGGTWAIGTNKVLIPDPMFNKKEAKKLHWDVDLDFVQTYNVSVYSPDSVASYEHRVKHTVIYQVSWTAELSREGELINPSIEKVEELTESKSVEPAKSLTALKTLLGLDSLATINTAMADASRLAATNLAASSLATIAGSLPDTSWVSAIPTLNVQGILPSVSGLNLPNSITTLNQLLGRTPEGNGNGGISKNAPDSLPGGIDDGKRPKKEPGTPESPGPSA